MPNTNYPNGFPNGVAIRDVPFDIKQGGAAKTFWVDSNTGSDGNKGTFNSPFATLDYAIGRCTANKGDTIYLAANHLETLTAAGSVTADVAGISIIGLGDGTNKPTFLFGTATTASFLISAAGVTVKNVLGVAGFDSLANPFHIIGDDVNIDVEWRDGSATVEAVRAMFLSGVQRNKVNLTYHGFIAGNACVNAIRLAACTDILLDVNFYGVASTSIVEFHTSACSNITCSGYYYNSGTTDLSKDIVDTVTGSTWFVSGYDGAAGASFSGGSASPLASDDVSAVSAQVTALQADVGNPSARSNMTSVEAMMGNPDTAGESLYSPSGSLLIVTKTLTSSAVVQAGVDITGTSTDGTLIVEDILMSTDATGLAAGTNFQIDSDNAKGVTTIFAETVANLGANATETLATGSVTSVKGVVLESGKKLIAKSTVADCTGAGTITLVILFRRVNGAANITAAS
jgi:hypothetical protein